MSVFATEVGLLSDHRIAMAAARELIRTTDRFPTIHEYRTSYHSIVRRAEADNARERGLAEPQTAGKIPDWVHVWFWCNYIREPRECRYFPHHRDASVGEPPYLSTDEYGALLEEWRRNPHLPRLQSAAQLVDIASGQ